MRIRNGDRGKEIPVTIHRAGTRSIAFNAGGKVQYILFDEDEALDMVADILGGHSAGAMRDNKRLQQLARMILAAAGRG